MDKHSPEIKSIVGNLQTSFKYKINRNKAIKEYQCSPIFNFNTT